MPGEKVRGQSVDIGQKQRPLTKWQGPYSCLKNGAGEGSRTLDLLFTKLLIFVRRGLLVAVQYA